MEALLAIDAGLGAMSGQENERLWMPDALTGPEWGEVRGMAQRALLLAVPTGSSPPEAD